MQLDRKRRDNNTMHTERRSPCVLKWRITCRRPVIVDVITLTPTDGILKTKSLYEYPLLQRCAIIIGFSILFILFTVVINWIWKGKPILESEISLINPLLFPILLLAMNSSGEPDVSRRREQFAYTTFVSSAYLFCLAASIYLFAFPASRKLFTMPIITTLMIVPWAFWSYRSSRVLKQINA